MHAFTIRDLTREDIKLLTQILHRYREDEQSAKRTQTLIAGVPPQLRRSGFLNLISNRTSRLPAIAPACSFHKPLNAHVIRSIFNLVALEVGVRINHLVARSDKFSFAQRVVLNSLRELHSMWLEPDVYSGTFLQEPLAEWSYQENKCEACILARIGENTDILTALRTVILSRTQTRKRRRQPRLTRWVEEWIDRHADLRLTLFQKSNEDGQEMKRAWKAAYKDRISHEQNSRREHDRQRADKVVETSRVRGNDIERPDEGNDETEPADHTGEDQYDFEHEIIDHYAALVSSQYLPLSNPQTSSIPIDGGKLPQAGQSTLTSNRGGWEDVRSVYWHPRRGPGWSSHVGGGPTSEQAVFDPSGTTNSSWKSSDRSWSNGMLGSTVATSISPSKSEKGRLSEDLADRYRVVMDCDGKRFSGSDYCHDKCECESGKRSASPTSTTWSMMYK